MYVYMYPLRRGGFSIPQQLQNPLLHIRIRRNTTLRSFWGSFCSTSRCLLNMCLCVHVRVHVRLSSSFILLPRSQVLACQLQWNFLVIYLSQGLHAKGLPRHHTLLATTGCYQSLLATTIYYHVIIQQFEFLKRH